MISARNDKMSCLATRSSFSVTCLFVVIICANLLTEVENESVFGIGARINGDQLLLKDVLHTPPLSLTEPPVIKFNYAISEPITYIEIESDKIVYAVVNFSYENDIIDGTISSINGQQMDGEQSKPEAFEVVIHIYGLNTTMLKINPSYKYNDYQQINGILKPKEEIHHQTIPPLNLKQENSNDFDDDLEYFNEKFDHIENSENFNDDNDNRDGDGDGDDDDDDVNEIDYEDDDFSDEYDKIIEQGQRQNGDFLVYETNQTSATASKMPSNHSINFYYIDIYYVTYVKFTIFEHYLDNPLDAEYVPPVVEYAHISPTTLKAIVTDHRTTSLFVQMQMYGFHPTQLPVDYKPFLSSGQITTSPAEASAFVPATTRPISSLRQIKILMNAQQSANVQQEQQQQPPNELGHQISPSNNSHVNCLQQVLSSSSTSSQQSSSNVGIRVCLFTPRWAIFNLILIIFLTIVFV